MLKTPSVMSSLRCVAGSSFRILRAASTSLCGKTLIVGAAQPRAVDDARVIQLVRDDHVLFRQDRRDRAGVRREAALKDDDGFRLLERGEPALELHVDRHRAGDRADRSRADAELARSP